MNSQGTSLIRYDAACRAVAEAKSVDEVQEIANRAEAARAYARQAKNRQLEIDAIEIRVRAERRLGELLVILRKDGILTPSGGGDTRSKNAQPRVTIKSLGIRSTDAPGYQRLARMPEPKFESEMTDWRAKAPTAKRLEVPLQRVRQPASRHQHQRRQGQRLIIPDDPFDRYRAPDGRRIADWRVGELNTLLDIGHRLVECVESVQRKLPVVPDPLATLEAVFTPKELTETLEAVWSQKKNQGGRRGA
jgi:hypothetical protein